MTLVILTEGIDLSLGAVLGLCGVVMSMILVTHGSLPLALGAALVIGIVAPGASPDRRRPSAP